MKWPWTKRIKKLPIPAIKITYQYHPDQPFHTYTYAGTPGKPLMKHSLARRFYKWYVSREQSTRAFITGEDGTSKEWRRKHIISIELLKDSE